MKIKQGTNGIELIREPGDKALKEIRYTVNDILSDDRVPHHRKVDKIMEVIYSVINR